MKPEKIEISIILIIVSLVVLSYSIISTTPVPISSIESYTGYDGMDSTSFVDCSNNPTASGCFSVKYINTAGNIRTKNTRISYNYWIDASGFIQQVPYGYEVSADKRSISPKAAYAMYNDAANAISTPTTLANDVPKQVYDTNNYNMQYHDDISSILQNANDRNTGVIWVVKDGQLIPLPQSDPDVKGEMLYYQPGSYKFGASAYIPGYEDSVFMSKMTRVNYASPIRNTASMLGGICNQYKSSPDQLEKACNELNKNVCASTSCCVLMGGEKCVSGTANGPTMKVNYNDLSIRNRDLYYYQGKCYGNCSNTFEYGSSNSDTDLNSYNAAYSNRGIPRNQMLGNTSQTGYRVSNSDNDNAHNWHGVL